MSLLLLTTCAWLGTPISLTPQELSEPAPPPATTHRTFQGTELAVAAGQSTSGPFILAAGEEAELFLPTAFPARSIGGWWQGQVGTAWISLLDEDGVEQGEYPFVEAHDLDAAHVGATGPAGSATIAALNHRYDEPAVAVRLRFEGPVQLRSLTLVSIGKPVVGPPMPPETKSPPNQYPKPSVYSRSQWGADPPNCTYSYCNTTHLAFHHTAGASEYNSTSWQQSATNVKNIQNYHIYTRGWCDIGYNYLIDVMGNIFEGRGGGDDVRGAHDGYNCGSMGTAFMGYFHTPYNQVLNQTMINAASELGAWKCDQQNIDPNGTSYYAGYGANMTNVYGHRDVSATACPGDLAYGKLGDIRSGIADRLNGGGGTEIIMDTGALALRGDWTVGTSSSDKYGADYRWTSSGITPQRIAYWRPNISSAGFYTVYLWWPQGSNRNPNTLVGARIQGVTHTTTVNQQINGGQWNSIGTWWFPAGTSSLVGVANDGSTGFVVMADAVRLVKQ